MYNKYVINSGDSLKDIAKKFNVLEDSILSINNVRYPDMLRAGMEIIVPQDVDDYFDVYTINKGDSIYAISSKYNINPELLAALNGLDLDDYIYPNQKIMIPRIGYSYYITKDGDTLKLVADRLKISEKDVIRQNDSLYLSGGQLIVKKSGK